MQLLRKVLKAIKEHPTHRDSLIDSFSDNQFASKDALMSILRENDIIHKDLDVVILGCWYGSILVEYLAPLVRSIYMIDMDDEVIRIGKNELFPNYDNVDWSTADIFNDKIRNAYTNSGLIINTSCEHMPPMSEWPYWDLIQGSPYFVFQSNNMFDIEGHINCVNSMEEFKKQYCTKQVLVVDEEEIEEERGTRYMVLGQFR